jgi:hypothetical protein
MFTQLADEQPIALIDSFNAQGLPPASEIGVARLRSAASERAPTRPRSGDE